MKIRYFLGLVGQNMELFLSRYRVTSVIRIDELAWPMQLVIACGWVPLEGKLSLGVTLTLLAIPGRSALHPVYLHSSFCCGLSFQIYHFCQPATGFPVQDESSLQIMNKLSRF